MTQTPAGLAPCYRHPEEITGIRCQRCGKPICADCMIPASVGFQCPGCVRGIGGLRAVPGGRSNGRGASGGRQREARTAFGARLSAGGLPVVTTVLVAAMVLLSLLDAATGLPTQWLGFQSLPGTLPEPWRPVTYLLLQSFPFGLFNSLVLFLVGRTLEPQFGRWRFLAIFVISGLGGAALLSLFAPAGFLWPGGTLGVLGLIGANTAAKLRTHSDIKPDLILLALLVGVNLVLSFRSMYWVGLIGGLLAAAAATLVVVFAPRDRRTGTQVGGLLGVAAVCVAGIALGSFAGSLT